MAAVKFLDFIGRCPGHGLQDSDAVKAYTQVKLNSLKELLGKDVDMHKYAVQITVADARDGACSSSTLKEASSWGKVDVSKEQMVFAEATSVLPLIVSDAYHRKNWEQRKPKNFSNIFE